MSDKELPQEAYRIRELMGEFDAAVWKRLTSSGEDIMEAMRKDYANIYPQTAEEVAAWNKLTSPENRDALLKFIAFYGENVHDYAKKLDATLIAESDRRAATQGGGASNGPSNSGT